MASRFCTQCGQLITGNTKFCVNCGAPVPTQSYDGTMASDQLQYSQPQPQYSQPQQPLMPKPSNYLVISILATIFCCWPLGIPAIVNAAKVDSLWAKGDYNGAEEASNKAKKWTIAGAITGGIVVILYVVLVALGAIASLDY